MPDLTSYRVHVDDSRLAATLPRSPPTRARSGIQERQRRDAAQALYAVSSVVSSVSAALATSNCEKQSVLSQVCQNSTLTISPPLHSKRRTRGHACKCHMPQCVHQGSVFSSDAFLSMRRAASASSRGFVGIGIEDLPNTIQV